MAEQRVNAAGETVEYNEESGRYEPVGDGKVETAETNEPVSDEGETLVDDGTVPARRAREDDE